MKEAAVAVSMAVLRSIRQVYKSRRIIAAIGLITFIIYLMLFNRLENARKNVKMPQPQRYPRIATVEEDAVVWKEGSCRIPKLDPFNESIRHLINIEKEIDCATYNKRSKYPEIFGSDLNSHLIVLQDPKIFGYEDCCYTPFHTNTDQDETYANISFKLNETPTRIPSEYEFIAIYCMDTSYSYSITGWYRWMFNLERARTLNLVDMFSFIHADSPKNTKNIKPADHSPNIVILGIDSSSHTNLIRSMPRSFKYLVKNLSAIGMEGYGLFEERTLPNLLAVLTGLSKKELKSTCYPSSWYHFDKCKFIWQLFSSKGYITSYGEDNTDIGNFLYFKKGFKDQPTDYYLIPLSNAFYNNKLVHGGNGSSGEDVPACYGPRLGFKMLLNNIKEMAIAMKDKKYFQFSWECSLSHNNPNYAGAGDNLLSELLHWFKVEQRLESTIFIFMSDHGDRLNNMRQTEYGKIDVKMPFLYFIFPSWFSKKYDLAVENVRNNANKLTTPFDLHETLKDLLDLTSIENIRIKNRQANLLQNWTSPSGIPRGISLFLSIPDVSQRKCQEAKIPLHACFCPAFFPVSVKKPEVGLAAQNAVNFINQQIISYPQCAFLDFDKVISAHMINPINTDDNSTHQGQGSSSLIILVKFTTLPSNAIFEATMIEMSNKTNTEWILSGEISRINTYGDQSRCVEIDTVKTFCYCD